MQDLDKFLVDLLYWASKEMSEVDGIWLLGFTRDKLVDFRDRLGEGEGDWESSNLECVIEDLKCAIEDVSGMLEDDKEVEGEAEEKEESEDQARQDPEAEDKEEGEGKGNGDPEEDQAQGRAEKETQTEEDDMRQALGVEEEEGEAEEEEEREDDAQGLDEGFKEDDQGNSGGARKGGLTMTMNRQWWDLFFYDSEVDGDEGFEDDEEEEREQPRVEDERGERRGRGRTKLESLHKDWETWDEKGLSRGDTKRPWRFDEGGEDLLTRGGGSVGEIKLDCREARAERDSNMQVGRSAPEERGEDLRSGANKKMKKEIKTEA